MALVRKADGVALFRLVGLPGAGKVWEAAVLVEDKSLAEAVATAELDGSYLRGR